MQKKITSFFIENKLIFIATFFYCFIQFIYFYKNGTIIFGGEGNYWIDFKIYLKNHGYTWLNTNTGIVATSMNAVFSYPLIFSFIDNLALKSFLIVSIIYLMPLIVCYILLININNHRKIEAFLLSIFFITNPFSYHFLGALNAHGVHTLFMYPLYFFILYKYYDFNFKLFFSIGLISLFFAYTNANPPQMILLNGCFIIFILIIQIKKFHKINWTAWFKKISIIYSSIILFNIWWIIHWILVIPDAKKMYTNAFAKSYLLSGNSMIFKDIFSLSWLVPENIDYSFLAYFFNTPFVKILLFIPFIIVPYWFFIKNPSKKNHRIIYFLLAIILSTLLFLKGANAPFKYILPYCFDNIPFCNVFKTAPEKFGVPFIFLLTILLFFILNDLKNKWIIYFLFFYVFICLIPIFTGKYIPDYKIDENQYGSRKYFDSSKSKNFRSYMKDKRLDFRLLSLPSGGNYQVMIFMYDNKYYTGIDPLLMNIPQSFIADYSGNFPKSLFDFINPIEQKKILPIYNINYVIFDKNLIPWFKNPSSKSLNEQESILNKNYRTIKKFEDLTIYSTDYYLPHFYTSQVNIISKRNPEELPKILSHDDWKIRSTVFFENQNIDKNIDFLKKQMSENNNESKLPILEFKKINMTKYRVRVHSASESFSLVFSESFHKKWKAYITKSQISNSKFQSDLNNYKILDRNEDDQANIEELSTYIQNGFVSTLGNQKEKTIKHQEWNNDNKKLTYIEKYRIDFISKNFQGTIQNDNLPNGSIFETWLVKSSTHKEKIFDLNKNVIELPKENHLMANGYANSWIINPGDLCNQPNNTCKKNPDGTYEFELVIEFWPQHIFYIGLFISGITLLLCFGYSVYSLKKIKSNTF